MNDARIQSELMQYLTGLDAKMPDAFFHLAEIIKYEAFELCADAQNGNYLIPYMMNDALEYYLVLQNAHMTGEYLAGEALISAQIVREEERYVLILRQESGNTCTVLFQEMKEHAACYQYHRIGHFWVKGQEHWRRLVYIIGTIYDKYEYFGDRFCTEKEKELMQLIRFAPFRFWSPISESLDDRYADAPEGFALMYQFAQKAGDREYLRMMKWYRRFPFRVMAAILARALCDKKRRALYELICSEVESASMAYPERRYDAALEQEIAGKRQEAEELLRRRGFKGVYPHFEKDGTTVFAAEEHPFTILEWDDYTFRIRFLICRDGESYIEEIQKN